MTNRNWGAMLALAAALVLASTAGAEVKTGNPNVKSIEAIAFGPDGLLLIGDGKGAQVVTVQTGDTTLTKWTRNEVPNIKEELAGRLGTTGKGIEIIKLAVNPASQVAYIAVRKIEGKQDLVMTVDANGKVREFSLENVKYSAYPLPPGERGPITRVTDITYADGRILLAAQANETFASRIYAIDIRQDRPEATFISTETFHVAHNKWETHAPIRTVIPYKENNKSYLVGAFTCTPLVKYSLDDLKPGGKVKGTSVIELGNGNEPRDMFTYEKGGKQYILVSTIRKFHARDPVGPSPYWVAKVEYTILGENEKVNEKALRRVGKSAKDVRTDRAVVATDYHGTVFMDRLNNDQALVIMEDKGNLNLKVLALP